VTDGASVRPQAQFVALEGRERPFGLLGADPDKLAPGEEVPALVAQARHRDRTPDDLPDVLDAPSGTGRSPPQRPAGKRVLATRPPPVVVRAGTAPRRRIDHVHGALRAGDEESGAATGDADADRALAPAGEVGNEDVLGAGYARGEGGTGGAHSGEFLLDAGRDGLD